VLGLVSFVQVGDLRHERIIGIGVSQQRADREKNLRDGQSRRPLILQDVKADATIAVDIHMVDLRSESKLRWLERVIGREMNVQEENTLMVRGVLGSHDRSLPVELVLLVGGSGGAVRGRVPTKVYELLLDSFKRHNIVY